MANGFPAELQKRLEERGREERSQAKLLIGLGIPFAAVMLFGPAFLLSFLLWLIGMKYLLAFLLGFVAVGGLLALDTWKHPSAHAAVAAFYRTGTAANSEKGPLAGLPTGIIDDAANLAVQSDGMSRGCVTVLTGPRDIRKGLEQLRAVEAKSETKVESAAVRFLAWLKQTQPQTEEEIATQLAKDPSLRQGFALASELGFIRRRQEGPQRLFEMKEPSMREE